MEVNPVVDKVYPGPCSSRSHVLYLLDKLGLFCRACSSRSDLAVARKALWITQPNLNAARAPPGPPPPPTASPPPAPCSSVGHLPSRSPARPPGSVFGEPAQCAARCLCARAALHRSDVPDRPATALGLRPCPRRPPRPLTPVKLVPLSTAQTLQTGRPPHPSSTSAPAFIPDAPPAHLCSGAPSIYDS
jgi:hypothetical protein